MSRSLQYLSPAGGVIAPSEGSPGKVLRAGGRARDSDGPPNGPVQKLVARRATLFFCFFAQPSLRWCAAPGQQQWSGAAMRAGDEDRPPAAGLQRMSPHELGRHPHGRGSGGLKPLKFAVREVSPREIKM